MHILLTGLNHTTAPLEVREGVAFSKEQLPEALSLLSKLVREGMILSTCNRTEIYAATDNPEKAAKQIRRFLTKFHGVPQESFSRFMYDCTDSDAVHHLFRVSAGLDSMIVGESQILGQVRDALSAASDAESVQLSLVGLFHAAVRVGRRVREETEIGRNALSISFAGVKLAQRVLGDLNQSRVLLVGAGEAGQLVARALRTVGVGDLMIANRTDARANALADELGGRAVDFNELTDVLGVSDIVIAATGAPEYVISKEMMVASSIERGDRAQFIFDLAMPRDVDPEVASLDGVRLFNIDDLESIAEENLEQRKRAATHAEKMVEEELQRFMTWWDSLDAVPVIKSLRQQAEDIRTREVRRAIRKMDGISPENIEVLEALTRSIVNRILHDSTVSLKQRTDKSQLQAAKDLFRIWDQH